MIKVISFSTPSDLETKLNLEKDFKIVGLTDKICVIDKDQKVSGGVTTIISRKKDGSKIVETTNLNGDGSVKDHIKEEFDKEGNKK